jgi:hypothetical protein
MISVFALMVLNMFQWLLDIKFLIHLFSCFHEITFYLKISQENTFKCYPPLIGYKKFALQLSVGVFQAQNLPLVGGYRIIE